MAKAKNGNGKKNGLPTDKSNPFYRKAFMAGRDAALAIVVDETDTQSATDNGQVWVNCANQIADRIRAIEP